MQKYNITVYYQTGSLQRCEYEVQVQLDSNASYGFNRFSNLLKHGISYVTNNKELSTEGNNDSSGYFGDELLKQSGKRKGKL
jgi:hypothetical protein